jgi:hypothetical protein
LKEAIRADSGKMKEIDFNKLSTTVMLENRILYLQPVELSALAVVFPARGASISVPQLSPLSIQL